MEKADLLDSIEADRERLETLTRELWEKREVALSEHESAALLAEILENEGFTVTRGIGGLPTAFVAGYGAGTPRIGILGEYDALSGLSQRVATQREPIEEDASERELSDREDASEREPGNHEDAAGHGCGHNLFGVGSLGGASAIKRAIDAGCEGTVVYYGCPAEETLVGKVYMARAGVFDDLDAALSWHPSHHSSPFMARTLAMNSIKYTFRGETAHAGTAPESGRSALDAVGLMNTGVEYMREHIPNDARVHYSITDGGDAPNVVPARATVWYYVRAPTRGTVERLTDWLDDIAEGAALMTQTATERDFVTGCYSFLPNDRLSQLIHENQRMIGTIPFTDEDRGFATELKAHLSPETIQGQLPDGPPELLTEMGDRALYSEPQPPFDRGELRPGSTDVGDVSWITPTAQFWAAAWPVGTPAHSWQAVAASGSFGSKTAVYAAKVLAATAWDLLTDESECEDGSILADAHEAFDEQTAYASYETSLPEGSEPPIPSQ